MGYKDIEIRKSEFVAKTQLLCAKKGWVSFPFTHLSFLKLTKNIDDKWKTS